MTTHEPRTRATRWCLAITVVASLTGCASMNPVVYPNNHAKRAGAERLQNDIAACTRRADETVGDGERAPRVAKRVFIATAVGAAAGAAWGSVIGGASSALERGGAAAAGGAAGSAVKELLHINEPDAVHRKFVEKCLGKKGYEVLGWR